MQNKFLKILSIITAIIVETGFFIISLGIYPILFSVGWLFFAVWPALLIFIGLIISFFGAVIGFIVSLIIFIKERKKYRIIEMIYYALTYILIRLLFNSTNSSTAGSDQAVSTENIIASLSILAFGPIIILIIGAIIIFISTSHFLKSAKDTLSHRIQAKSNTKK